MSMVLAVLAASVLGSVHCAAMCGAFVCNYALPRRIPPAAGDGTSGGTRHGTGAEQIAASHAAYHLGRLVSYAALGAVAGFAGRGADTLGALMGIGRGAAIVGGTLMVAWGASAIATAFGARGWAAGPRPPAWMARSLGAILVHVRETRPVPRAAITGLVTTLLPCGWLYAFVATAATTGSALGGAGVMAIFWLGTVPMLLAVAFGVQRFFGPFARRLPALSALVVLVAGLFAISGRIPVLSAVEPVHAHDRRTDAR